MGSNSITKILLTAVPAVLVAAQGALAQPHPGEKVYNRCKTCHVLEGDARRIGPSLECVFGRTAGAVEGFKYSPVMAESGVVWDRETMGGYLANPRAYMPGNRMAFPGLKNEQQLADLLDYLEGATASANCP